MSFSSTISSWYNIHKRNLPWRNTQDAYLIWLSEIILQQTRVNQGMPYYLRFVEQYPCVADLANAAEEQVLRLWQGLGYYSRARNLHATAKIVMERHNGKFPCDYHALLKLKGIGEYTAAAIASFSANEAHAVLDGNVYRLLARYFGIETPIDTGKGKKLFRELAHELLDKEQAGMHNQAIMEFGALQCKPKQPECHICPLKLHCRAYQGNTVGNLPVKSQKTKIRNRYFNYLVINQNGSLLLNKRTEKDIWQNLYDFPLIESGQTLKPNELLAHPQAKTILQNQEYAIVSTSPTVKHVLSHQIIYARFMEFEYYGYPERETSYISVLKEDMGKYALPKLIENYLKNKT